MRWGNNRDQSLDSRYWGFVELSKIKGKAIVFYWSWDNENSRVRWERIGHTEEGVQLGSPGVVDNPVCRVSMEQENNTRDRWLTTDEEMRLLHVAAPWLRELMLFATHIDMRMGEILGLTWAGSTCFGGP